MNRIKEIRAAIELLKRPHKVHIEIGSKPPTMDISGIADVYGNGPRALAYLLAEHDRQAEQLSRIKTALLAAGCSDYTDDVARMAEEFLAGERREARTSGRSWRRWGGIRRIIFRGPLRV